MINTIIFDIDNTLYDYEKANECASREVFAYCKKQFGWEMEQTKAFVHIAHEEERQVLKSPCAALHNRLIRFQLLLEKEQKPLEPHALALYECYWNKILTVMKPEPGVLQFFFWAKKKNIRIGIGTDMTAYMQYKKLQKLGLLHLIDFMVSSEEAGEEKPGQGFYSLCLRKARCRPEECLMIGDSLEKDVLGAKRMGMKALWYNPKAKSEEIRAQKEKGIMILSSYLDMETIEKE